MKKTLIALTLALVVGCSQQTTEQQLAEAQAYLDEGKTDAAMIALKNAVQLSPQSAQARFELGKLYLAEKDYASAEKELDRALEYGQPPSDVIPLLSQVYSRMGSDVALTKLEHETQGLSNVEKMQVGYFKLVSMVRLDQQEEASALIDELLAIDTASFYKGLVEVYQAVLAQDYRAALEKVAAVREEVPLEAEPMKVQGQLMLGQGDTLSAIEVYSQYVKQNPDDREIEFLLANLMVESGQLKEAQPHLASLLKLSKNNPLLNKLQAIVSASEKDFAAALKHTEIALQNNSGDPVLRLLAGYAAYEQQDFSAAHGHLSIIASQLPDNHPALRLLAASQLQLGLNDQVADVMARIKDPIEQDAMLFSKAGYELMRAGYIKDAEKLVSQSESISTSAEDLARLGVLQISLNKLEGLVNLEEAIAKSPELTNARTTLAVAYLADGQIDKAKALAQEWLAQSPEDPKAYLLKASIANKEKRLDDAKTHIEQAIALDQNYLPAQMELVNLYFANNQADKGQQFLKNLLAKAPDYVPALAMNYLVAKQGGDANQAIQKAQIAANNQPEDLALQLMMARIHLMEQAPQKALTVLNKLPESDDLPSDYWQLKGQALLKSSQVSEAEAFYQSWLQRAPNSKPALLGALLIADAKNDFNKGIDLTQAFLSNRDDLQVALLNTHFLLLNQDVEAGRKAYQALPQAVKESPISKSLLARLQIADKAMPEALESAQLAYEHTPNRRNLLLMVYCLELLEKPDAVYNLLQSYLQKNPNDGVAAMLFAEKQIAKGNDDAIASYRELLQRAPNNYIALNNLAYLLMQNGQAKEAQQYAEKAVEIRPNNVPALDTLAQVLATQGQYKEAIKYYERAFTNEVAEEEIHLNYIEALLAADQQKLALRRIESTQFTLDDSKARLQKLREEYGI